MILSPMVSKGKGSWCGCHVHCDCNPQIREAPHPRAPKSPKSLKKVFLGLLAQSVKTSDEKVPKDPKRVTKVSKSMFEDFFGTFLTLRAGRPGKTFLRLFGGFGAQGCGASCICWEILKGVGVDGAGGNLPFFCAFLCFSSLFWRESPFFWRFSSLFCALS